MIWTAIIILAPTLYFAKTVMDYIYPGQVRMIALKIGWKTMDLCSKIEIYAANFYNRYVPTLITSKPQAMIKFICDGDEIENYTLTDFFKKKRGLNNINYDSINYDSINYDFILHEVPILIKDKYTKYDNYVVRYENMRDVINVEFSSLKCFELNMIQMTVNGSAEYTIDLGRNQYMISGNKLFDRKFLKWYLNSNYNIVLETEDKYIVTFIDQNMNYITLTECNALLIKNNNYDIITETI